MVLASQMARPDTLRRFATTRRRRHSLRNALIIVLLIGGAVWALWPPSRPLDRADGSGAAAPAAALGKGASTQDGAAKIAAAAQTEQQRQLAAAEQEAFLKRLRGDTKAAAPSAAGQAVTAKLVEPSKLEKATSAKEKPARAAIPSVTIGKTAATPTPSAPKPVEKPATSGVTPTTTIDSATLAAAGQIKPAPSSAISIAPGVSEMVRRLTLTTPAAPGTPGSAGATLREGMKQIEDGKLVEGRKTLSRVLTAGDPSLTAADAQAIRDTLASVNKSLVFSDRAVDDDPLVETHTVASGELLSTIARKYKVTYQFLEQVNGVDARRIRIGQKLKTVKGPFHVVVDKSDFRLDVFAREADNAMIFITSFPVGIGKDDSTPVGSFLCKSGGKLANPSWTHPRTGKFFDGDDAENPIGEYWIGLQGTDEHTKGVRGYGIHGTIEPQSVGKQASLGCVRMLAKDIEQVYNLVVDGQSTVTIQP